MIFDSLRRSAPRKRFSASSESPHTGATSNERMPRSKARWMSASRTSSSSFPYAPVPNPKQPKLSSGSESPSAYSRSRSPVGTDCEGAGCDSAPRSLTGLSTDPAASLASGVELSFIPLIFFAHALRREPIDVRGELLSNKRDGAFYGEVHFIDAAFAVRDDADHALDGHGRALNIDKELSALCRRIPILRLMHAVRRVEELLREGGDLRVDRPLD